MVPPANIPGLPNDITPLIVFLAIGLLAGWLASLVLGGGGLLRNLIVGVIGSFVGGYVLNLAGIRLPIDNVWVSSIVTATIGALLVIAVARVVAK
ncbi:GlsB/YeaQ/YmgE family stress response membrane protein [Devosia sp. A16]|uniref:GlsB/YeaQ/YmgE family stress response membrane protein n=1 Tax=Devosia sp. A16 TaxID=1736675 RepID=UPI000AC37AD6|nr:GlsB/YeaQ/YmgE family stress response membrane protein [Devosia sp. A16]